MNHHETRTPWWDEPLQNPSETAPIVQVMPRVEKQSTVALRTNTAPRTVTLFSKVFLAVASLVLIVASVVGARNVGAMTLPSTSTMASVVVATGDRIMSAFVRGEEAVYKEKEAAAIVREERETAFSALFSVASEGAEAVFDTVRTKLSQVTEDVATQRTSEPPSLEQLAQAHTISAPLDAAKESIARAVSSAEMQIRQVVGRIASRRMNESSAVEQLAQVSAAVPPGGWLEPVRSWWCGWFSATSWCVPDGFIAAESRLLNREQEIAVPPPVERPAISITESVPIESVPVAAPTRTVPVPAPRVNAPVAPRSSPVATTPIRGADDVGRVERLLQSLESRLGIRIEAVSQQLRQPIAVPAQQVIVRESFSGGGASVPVYANNFGLSQKIDTLTNTTITGGSISGATISGGSVTATAFSGTIGVGQGGTGTTTAPTTGQVLLGNAAGGYDLVATSSLGISGGGGASSFGQTFELVGGVLQPTTTVGMIVAASSTFSGGITATNATTGNSTSTNTYATSLVAGSATSTSLFSTVARFATGILDTLSATIATIANLTVTDLVATRATTTNATSTNLYAENLRAGALTGVMQAIGGVFSATSSISQNVGGTGQTSYTAGDILYANASGVLTKLPVGGAGQVLKVSGGLPGWGADSTSGGGGAGAWATTTDNLAVYPSETSDVVIVGNSATTTASSIFEVIGQSYFSGNIGVGTTSPFAKLSIAGSGYFDQHVTATNITATGTLSVAGNTLLANATSTSFAITNILSTILKTNGSGSIVPAIAGTDYVTSAITALGAAGQTQTGATQLFATSTSAFNGLTSALTIVSSGNTHTFTPALSGTLTVEGGGTGATSLTGLLQGNGTGAITAVTGTAGQFPYFNGANTLAATSTIFLATNGNVGIGTTTPASLLNLAGAAPKVTLTDNGASTNLKH